MGRNNQTRLMRHVQISHTSFGAIFYCLQERIEGISDILGFAESMVKRLPHGAEYSHVTGPGRESRQLILDQG